MQLNAFSRRSIIGNDPAKIRDWAQAAEDLGYAYIERSRWSVRHSSPFADVRRSLPDRCRFIYARHRSCNIPV
jgi:hypothetical protein